MRIRYYSSSATPPVQASFKIPAPPMVYIAGEEMTRYAMELMLDKWIRPHLDISRWEFYDLSCKHRDETNDQVLEDAVDAGKRLCSIFKEPTVTPDGRQKKKMGLKNSLPSPNGLMRYGWNGITISRDTIHIHGRDLGFSRPVIFDRHAVGGEYSAGFSDNVGPGRIVTKFFPEDGSEERVIDDRMLQDSLNSVVTYHNPYDNVEDLGHIFFKRCLLENVTPYVVTKKTVFKWQEPFWLILKKVFDEHYLHRFQDLGLLEQTGGQLQHLISDAATMQILKWKGGGFGMASHNYDGDMLTDEISQVHGSPGFITSNLTGKREDGTLIKEFEASHGTVADLWQQHKQGRETSLNPLGLIEALIGAINYSTTMESFYKAEIQDFTRILRNTIHKSFVAGFGTRDLSGDSGLTTEGFVEHVSNWLKEKVPQYTPKRAVDHEQLTEMFKVPTVSCCFFRRFLDVFQILL